MTEKKVTKVDGGASTQKAVAADAPKFTPTPESKKKASTFRLIAILAWVVAIGFEVWAFFQLKTISSANNSGMTSLIILIVVDFIFAVCGSLLWKKANRLDPASEKEPTRFFIQNQLGAFISIIAFLPLILLILFDKDISGKQKGILAAIAIVAFGGATYAGVDTNPISSEQLAAQSAEVQQLMGTDNVYWTKSGTKYHLFDDCQHINTDATTEIFNGTVADARALKNITELCATCKTKAEKNMTQGEKDAVDQAVDAAKEAVNGAANDAKDSANDAVNDAKNAVNGAGTN